jgi:hypothetical protein
MNNTKIIKIEKKYGKDFNIRSNKKWINFLNKKGYFSLVKLLKY